MVLFFAAMDDIGLVGGTGVEDGRSSGSSDNATRRTFFAFPSLEVGGSTSIVDSTLDVTDKWLNMRRNVFKPLLTSLAVGTELCIVRMTGRFLTS